MGSYLGVKLHNSLLKVVQVLVPVAEPTQKAGEILGGWAVLLQLVGLGSTCLKGLMHTLI